MDGARGASGVRRFTAAVSIVCEKDGKAVLKHAHSKRWRAVFGPPRSKARCRCWGLVRLAVRFSSLWFASVRLATGVPPPPFKGIEDGLDGLACFRDGLGNAIFWGNMQKNTVWTV